MKKLLTIIGMMFVMGVTFGQTKISELTPASVLGTGDLFVIVQSSTTKSMTGTVLMNAVSDTADQVRQAISDSINDISLSGITIDSNSVDQHHFKVGAVNALYMQSTEAHESVTGTTGDSLVQQIEWPFLGEKDKVRIKAVFGNGGQNDNYGRIRLYDSNGSTAQSWSTEPLEMQGDVTGVIELEITRINDSTVSVLRKISTYDNFNGVVTVETYDYRTYDVESAADAYARIYINADDAGFSCFDYSAEVIFYDPKYYDYIQNN